MNEQGQKRLRRVLKFLEDKKLLKPNIDVLDVGCGPGVYALSFAKQARTVCALDGAREMCAILEDKAKQEGLNNIKVLQRMWEDVDLKKEGMEHAFDLVFASLTSAVSNCETLLKLCQASRGTCCLISWAGSAEDQVCHDLWELIIGSRKDDRGQDIIFPFNYLYHSGYHPNISYIYYEWIEDEPIDEAVVSLCNYFGRFTDITPKIKGIIIRYAQKHAHDGILHQVTRSRLGVMAWQVDR